MSVFGEYSQYYDLMYEEKDYDSEVGFVLALARQYRPDLRSLLELGCGSGGHAQLLAKSGLSVCGVDRSDSMVEIACNKRHSLPKQISERLTFVKGDLRCIALGKRFDGVLSLFHVMSYQNTNLDVANAFKVVGEHLAPGGVFVFDCWYGPGVLSTIPETRVRRWTKAGNSIVRIAEPVLNANENTVDVNYTLIVTEGSKEVRELKETHKMRYFFAPELEFFASQAGLRVVKSCEWMTTKEPSLGSWNACFVVCA
jgi:SAM-dependent methyltransferase